MFSKGNKKSSQNSGPSAPKKNVPPSIISADLTISGHLFSEGEIQVDGIVKGDIRSKELLVGEKALIEGEIMVESLRVHGKVIGQIKALRVSLAKTSHVVGDIVHDNLSIETGAYLEGLCKRLNEGEFDLKQKPDAIKPTKTSLPTAKVTPATKKASA